MPQLPAGAAYALQQLVNALALAAVYALLATAYSLIYGLVGRINLAFGEIAVLGAYGAIGGVAAAIALGVGDAITGLALAFVLAAAISAGWSVLVGRLVIEPLHARHRLGQPILIATAAVALSVQEFLRISQGARERWTPPAFNQPIALARAQDFIVTVTPMQIVVACLGLAAAGGVLFCSAARVSAAPGAPSPTIRGRPRCSVSMGSGSSPRPSCSPACSRASPDGSWRPITATSRFRWARCSD